MTLSPLERKITIARLRANALAACKRQGCTCQPEPRLELTDHGIGPHDLPAWQSFHADDCPMTIAARQAAGHDVQTAMLYSPGPGEPGPQG